MGVEDSGGLRASRPPLFLSHGPLWACGVCLIGVYALMGDVPLVSASQRAKL